MAPASRFSLYALFSLLFIFLISTLVASSPVPVTATLPPYPCPSRFNLKVNWMPLASSINPTNGGTYRVGVRGNRWLDKYWNQSSQKFEFIKTSESITGCIGRIKASDRNEYLRLQPVDGGANALHMGSAMDWKITIETGSGWREAGWWLDTNDDQAKPWSMCSIGSGAPGWELLADKKSDNSPCLYVDGVQLENYL